jgi:hypothetical protein
MNLSLFSRQSIFYIDSCQQLLRKKKSSASPTLKQGMLKKDLLWALKDFAEKDRAQVRY